MGIVKNQCGCPVYSFEIVCHTKTYVCQGTKLGVSSLYHCVSLGDWLQLSLEAAPSVSVKCYL